MTKDTPISKHLMLLFIGILVGLLNITAVISKHLMLLFIQEDREGIPMETDFKTSHVIVYLSLQVFYRQSMIISKHLMLLFI